MPQNIIYLCSALVFILLSCNSNKGNQNKISESRTEDTLSNPRYIIENRTKNIGKTEMILINDIYGFEQSYTALGTNSKNIDKKIKEILPDSIRVDDLPMDQIPFKEYLNQDALDYLSEYIIKNCDTLVFDSFYDNSNAVYHLTTYGDKDNVHCICGEPKRVIEYFEGMLEWINNYPEKEAFEKISLFVISAIRYSQKLVNENR